MPFLSSEIVDSIRELTLRAAQEPKSSVNRTVVDAIGALSVYANVGGALALMPKGEVGRLDFEGGATSTPDENMQAFALVRAA
jgi:hypothetical protein